MRRAAARAQAGRRGATERADPGAGASIEALASELTQDLQLRLEGDAATQIATAMSEIDMSDTKSILFFGTKAQQQLTSISDMMLEDVRTKDIGPAGDALNSMVQKLRELDFEDIDPRDKPNWLQRLFGLKNQVLKYIDEYEGVRDQIDKISTELELHKTRLLTDITKLDKLYDANLDYFRMLEVYIAAGAPSSRSWTSRPSRRWKRRRRRRGRHPGAKSARPAFGARRSGAPRARSAADAPGHHAEPAEHPPGAGERQVAGQQDQLDDREYRAAVAPAAGPGDHHLPRRTGGAGRSRRHRT